jgi:hypothetical protein
MRDAMAALDNASKFAKAFGFSCPWYYIIPIVQGEITLRNARGKRHCQQASRTEEIVSRNGVEGAAVEEQRGKGLCTIAIGIAPPAV